LGVRGRENLILRPDSRCWQSFFNRDRPRFLSSAAKRASDRTESQQVSAWGFTCCRAKRRHFSCLPPGKPNFLKILLRGFKSSLISAARPHKSGGSEDEVKRYLKKFDLTTKFEQVYVSFAGETSETGRKTGNVLIVLGLQIGSILSRLNC
jgi:hypothetical protein